ncbi:MAG: SRPBCC domain-containing protein [Acidimicrobiia bacterium]|nr:SRPBCC domain-containing protein [Acidimicrobiia bacterium]MDJ0664257.1 SRPBCC domain-containing protein [Acidimicrobiia bacterium]
MTITAIHKDPEKLTMSFTAEFDSTPERVWQLWADPRLFEKWWGPPEYPATVVEHEFTPGGKVRYYMTGPEGEKYHGFSEFIAIDPPKALELGDGFLDDDGNEVEGMPTMTSRVDISDIGDATRMVITTMFPSLEAMEQLIEMGAEEGMKGSLSQVPDLLAAMA